MADIAQAPDTAPPARKAKKALLISAVVAALAAGGGFLAAVKGFIPSGTDTLVPGGPGALPDIAYVALAPVVVNLGPGAQARHLRFSAQLEVASPYRRDVELLIPRVLDIVNGYLRALDPAMLESQGALVRIRAQLLRRIQMVTGDGRVRDLLVSEFVLN